MSRVKNPDPKDRQRDAISDNRDTDVAGIAQSRCPECLGNLTCGQTTTTSMSIASNRCRSTTMTRTIGFSMSEENQLTPVGLGTMGYPVSPALQLTADGIPFPKSPHLRRRQHNTRPLRQRSHRNNLYQRRTSHLLLRKASSSNPTNMRT